jgi:hypothetical protein
MCSKCKITQGKTGITSKGVLTDNAIFCVHSQVVTMSIPIIYYV